MELNRCRNREVMIKKKEWRWKRNKKGYDIKEEAVRIKQRLNRNYERKGNRGWMTGDKKRIKTNWKETVTERQQKRERKEK